MEWFIRHSAYLRHTFRIGPVSFSCLLEAFRVDSALILEPLGMADRRRRLAERSRTYAEAFQKGSRIIPKGSGTLADHPEAFQNKRFGVQILKLLKLRCRIFFDPDQFQNDPEWLRNGSGMTPKGSRSSRSLAESSRICRFYIREPFGNHSGP